LCALLGGLGCSGASDAPGPEGGLPANDAGRTAGDDATSSGRTGGPVPDAAAPPDATALDASNPDADANEDGRTAADANGDSAGTFEAGPVGGFNPAPSGTAVCETAWQQPGIDSAFVNNAGMAVDAANNAYVTLTFNQPRTDGFSGGPELDLGQPAAGYVLGVAVVKIGPSCNVVWERELGTASANSNASIQPAGIAIDGANDITIAGTVIGPMVIGDVTLDAGLATYDDAGTVGLLLETFVIRFDEDGNEVFSKAFAAPNHLLVADSFAVDSTGGTTLLASGGEHADFGAGPVPSVDGGTYNDRIGAPGNPYLVRLDGAGSVLSQQIFDVTAGPYVSITSDRSGHVWAETSSYDDGGGLDYHLLRLADDGGVQWSADIPAETTGFASNAGGQVGFFGSATGSDGLAVDTIDVLQADGGPGAITSTKVGFAFDEPQMALDDEGRAVVGAVFLGTVYRVPGGWTDVGDPQGVGFMAFDPSGALTSIGVQAGNEPRLLAMGLGPDGKVALLATSTPDGGSDSSNVFFVRMAR
jgi:hypothetical protein